MIDETVPKPREQDVKELRLALVCYGGVSLAIYMHGVTKEIHRLVRASEAFNGSGAISAEDLDPGERVYLRALEKCAAADDVKTRVVVDVIAGTSAGGINGICLAKALAHNLSQNALKDLWIDHGDIGGLVPGSGLAAKVPWKARALWQLVKKEPVLNGDQMSRWLLEAFRKMDASGRGGSLVPQDLALELFVPMTDFHGYERQFPLESPSFVRDRTHRHVMSFRHAGAQGQFDTGYNHALAFAARATSSFPAAFEPISFSAYAAAVGPGADDLGGRAIEFFSAYDANNAKCSEAYFVDGGVLNNYPFGPAIDAIQRKPAAAEVERRLIYIEPDPTFGDGRVTGGAAAAEEPTLIKTALGAYAGIPGNQPIIDELMRLDERNRNVRRVRDVIETSFEPVQQRVAHFLTAHDVDLAALILPDGDRIAALGEAIAAAARDEAGINYATYARLRRATLTDAYAELLSNALRFPAGSYQAAFVAGVLREFSLPSEPDAAQAAAARSAEIDATLAQLDLSYHERRLRFVIAALSWWYRDEADAGFRPPRRDLDRAKGVIYEAIAQIQGLAKGLASDPAAQHVLEMFTHDAIDRAIETQESFGSYARRNAAALEQLRGQLVQRIAHPDRGLRAIEENMYDRLREIAGAWPIEAKKRLLVRYVGFPYWDILVYPIQALAHVGERDHVSVARFSPRDATLVPPLDPDEGKLKGVKLAHFGAFLERPHRENDYLWGRLDAVELLLDLLARSACPPCAGGPPPQADEGLAIEALKAILDQEQSLEGCRDLMAHARRKLAEREAVFQMKTVPVRAPAAAPSP
jgi:patatin-related protein